MKAAPRAAALVTLGVAAFFVNRVLLGSPGCSPTWLTVSAALCSFLPFFIGVQHAVGLVTAGKPSPRASQYELAAAVAGVVAIALGEGFASQWASVCGLR